MVDRELVALGQDVTLFASGDSVTSAKLQPIWPTRAATRGIVRDPNALHMMMLEHVYRRSHEFDLMHFHLDYFPFSLMSRQPTPFITTLHGRLDLAEHQPAFATFSCARCLDFECAAAPGSQGELDRDGVSRAAWTLAADRRPPISPSSGASRPKSAWIGRLALPDDAGFLKIAAKVDRADQDYFDEVIRPLLASPGVEFIGEIGDDRSRSF